MKFFQKPNRNKNIEKIGFVWLGLWGVTEGLYRIIDGDPIEMLVLLPVLFFPITCVAGILGVYLVRSWAPLIPRLNHHFKHQSVKTTQLILASAILFSVWLGAVSSLISFLLSNVQTSEYRLILNIWGSVASGVILLLFFPLVYGSLSPIANIIVKRFSRRSLGLVVLVALLGLFAAIVYLPSCFYFLSYLPWAIIVPPACSLVIAPSLSLLLSHRNLVISSVSLCFLHVLLSLAPSNLGILQKLENSAQRTAGNELLYVLRRVTDFDGDGVSHLYLGSDCAPLDSKRAPILYDVPDDGIDQDCDGWDVESSTIPNEGRSSIPLTTPAPPPHILLITTDALSFRHTSMGGYEFDVTPNLSKFAAQSVSFSSAFANAPTTYMTLPILHTGRNFTELEIESGSRHGHFPFGLSSKSNTLARRLEKLGYDSVFIPGNSYFSESRWPGLATGFSRVESPPVGQHTAPFITQRVIANLESAKKPSFVWVHYFDHHAPYNIPENGVRFPVLPGFQGRLESAYNSELEMADRAWGDLFDYTRNRHDVVVIFTADHGESFDSLHREKPHSHCIRASETHIPLIMNVAGAKPRTVEGLVSHLDVFPTVLNLLGQPSEGYPGESLIPVLFDDREPSKEVVFLSFVDPRKAATKSAFLQYGAVGFELLFLNDRTKNQISLFSLDNPVQEATLNFEHFPRGRGLKAFADRKYFEVSASNQFVETFHQSVNESRTKPSTNE